MKPEEAAFYKLAAQKAYDPARMFAAMHTAENLARKRNESRTEHKRAIQKASKERMRADPVRKAKANATTRKYRSEPVTGKDGKTRSRGAEMMRNWMAKGDNRERHNARVREYRATPEGKAKRKAYDLNVIKGTDGKERTQRAENLRLFRERHPEYYEKYNAESRERIRCEDGKVRTRGSRAHWLRRNPQWRIEGFKPIPVKTGAEQ